MPRGARMYGNQPRTRDKQRGVRSGLKWSVLIRMAVTAIVLGLAWPARSATVYQTSPQPACSFWQGAFAQKVAESGPRFLHLAEDHGVLLELTLVALSMTVGSWGVFRPGKPPGTTSNAKSINQQTSGVNNQPVAIQQSGDGSSVHIHGDPETARLAAEYAEKYGQAKQLIESFLRHFQKDGVPPEKWGEALNQKVEEYRKFQAQAAALQTDDPETKRLIDEARELAGNAKFEEAYQKLDQASERELKAADELEAAFQKRKINAAEVLAIKALLKNTEWKYSAAGQLFEKAAKLVDGIDGKIWKDNLFFAASAYLNQGQLRGDNASLKVALVLFEKVLQRINRDEDPKEWAGYKSNIGNVFLAIGQRQPSTEFLVKAVAAYREALGAVTVSESPMDWAMIKVNLGAALASIGEREAGTDHLEEAEKAFNQALDVYTRQAFPWAWAQVQTSLGNVLFALGSSESGTRRLRQAETAHVGALEVCTHQASPWEWATIKNNLGNTLLSLGIREPDAGRLEQAVTVFRQAIEIRNPSGCSNGVG